MSDSLPLEKNKKIPGPPVGYTDLVDCAIEEKIANETYTSFPLRPSAAGYCSRRLAYDLMEFRGKAKYEKEKMTPAVYRLLNLGHSVEYSAIKNFELMKFVSIKYKQQTVTLFRLDPVGDEKQGQLIEGKIDLTLWSDELKCVMDVKSAKDGWSAAYGSRWEDTLEKYRKLKSVQILSDTAFYIDDLPAFIEEVRDDFLEDNLVQLNTYCCTQFFVERGVDHGVILKYNKNDSRQYELRFRPSMSLFENVKAKFNVVNKAVAEGKPELAPKDSFLGSARCGFCPYATMCWEENAKKEYFKTFPKKKWPTDTKRLGALGATLEEMFTEHAVHHDTKKAKDALEERIIQILVEKKINKIKLDNGLVYEIKYLKTPRPHYELRRSKL